MRLNVPNNAETASSPPPLSRKRRIKTVLFTLNRIWVVALFRLLFGLRIEGLENVPRQGSALVVSNHVHNADPIIIIAAFSRPILFMAKKEVFAVPGVGWFARFCGAFPVDRGNADRVALRTAEKLLKEGMLVGVFPEGTRSTTGGLKQPYPGVAMIASRTGAPVIPAAIIDSDSLPFNGKKGRRRTGKRPRVVVRIGRPFYLPACGPDGVRLKMPYATDLIMLQIAELLPHEYRGIYADRMTESDQVEAAPDLSSTLV